MKNQIYHQKDMSFTYRQRSRNGTGRIEHFFSIVHDAHGGIFGKDNQIHAGQSDFGAPDNFAELFGVGHHFKVGMEAGHGVLKDTHADRVGRTGNIAMAGHDKKK